MISASPATDSSYLAKNTTTTITTKYFTSLKTKEEEKNELEQNIHYIRKRQRC